MNIWARCIILELILIEFVVFIGLWITCAFNVWWYLLISGVALVAGNYLASISKPIKNFIYNYLMIDSYESKETRTFWNSVKTKDIVEHGYLVGEHFQDFGEIAWIYMIGF